MYVRVFMVLAKKGKSYFSRSGKFLQNVLKIWEKSRNLFSGCRYLSIAVISVKTPSVHTKVGTLDFK